MSQSRKYKIACLLAIQSEGQLIKNYSREEALVIRQNANIELLFPGQELETCQRIERILGKRQYESATGQKKVVPLLSAQEVRDLEMDNAIVVPSGMRPFIARLRPYYKTRLRHLTKIPPPKRESLLPWTDPPLIHFD